MDKGLVSSTAKSRETIEHDRYRLLLKVVVFLILTFGVFMIGYCTGIKKEQQMSLEDRQRIVELEAQLPTYKPSKKKQKKGGIADGNQGKI